MGLRAHRHRIQYTPWLVLSCQLEAASTQSTLQPCLNLPHAINTSSPLPSCSSTHTASINYSTGLEQGAIHNIREDLGSLQAHRDELQERVAQAAAQLEAARQRLKRLAYALAAVLPLHPDLMLGLQEEEEGLFNGSVSRLKDVSVRVCDVVCAGVSINQGCVGILAKGTYSMEYLPLDTGMGRVEMCLYRCASRS